MKRFQILILTIMLASLSACATNSLPSSSTESSVSISVSNPQDFLSELEDMETSQILEELKIQMADIPKIVFRYCLSGLLNYQKIRFVY